MKWIIGLLVSTVVFLGVAVYRHREAWFGDGKPRKSTTTQETADVPLPAISFPEVQAIEVTDPSGTRRLVKSGENWVVPDRSDALAKPEAVKALFDGLDGLERSSLVGRNPTKHPDYEVDEKKARRIKLEGSGGTVLLDLLVGKADQARPGAARGTYVRAAGRDEIRLHAKSLMSIVRSDHRAWLDLRLHPADQAKVQELLEKAKTIVVEADDVNLTDQPEQPPVERSGNRYRLVLESEKVAVPKPPETPVGPKPDQPPVPAKEFEMRWKVVEPEADRSIELSTLMVEQVIRQLLGGTFDDVKGKDAKDPAFGLEKPAVDLLVTFEDGSTRGLKVGAPIPKDEAQAGAMGGMSLRYAQIAGSPVVVSLNGWAAKLFQKRASELQDPAKLAASQPVPAPPSTEIQIPPEEGKAPDPEKK